MKTALAIDRKDFASQTARFDAIITDIKNGVFPQNRYIELLAENLYEEGQYTTFLGYITQKMLNEDIGLDITDIIEIIRNETGSYKLDPSEPSSVLNQYMYLPKRYGSDIPNDKRTINPRIDKIASKSPKELYEAIIAGKLPILYFKEGVGYVSVLSTLMDKGNTALPKTLLSYARTSADKEAVLKYIRASNLHIKYPDMSLFKVGDRDIKFSELKGYGLDVWKALASNLDRKSFVNKILGNKEAIEFYCDVLLDPNRDRDDVLKNKYLLQEITKNIKTFASLCKHTFWKYKLQKALNITDIHVAIILGDKEEVRRLLENIVELDLKSMEIAILYNRNDMVELFVAKRNELKAIIAEDEYRKCFMRSTDKHIEIFKYLLSNDKEKAVRALMMPDQDGITPLHNYAKNGDVLLLKEAMSIIQDKRKAFLASSEKSGSPLGLAIQNNQIDVVRLIFKECDVTQFHIHIRAFAFMIKTDNIDMLKAVLIDKPAYIKDVAGMIINHKIAAVAIQNVFSDEKLYEYLNNSVKFEESSTWMQIKSSVMSIFGVDYDTSLRKFVVEEYIAQGKPNVETLLKAFIEYDPNKPKDMPQAEKDVNSKEQKQEVDQQPKKSSYVEAENKRKENVQQNTR